MNKIGEVYGFNMAESELAWLGGQIRFLSRYFLANPNVLKLEHGADLYAGYLNDREFVEQIENQHQAANFFTVQFTEETIRHFFPDCVFEIMQEFVKMIIFDGLVGNNDRHFYNWGIISNIQGRQDPKFSPIYDTARRLFWNDHEDKIKEKFRNELQLSSFITKYAESSFPKIGWEGLEKLNHFSLIEKLKTLQYVISCDTFSKVCADETLGKALYMIDADFNKLLSAERRELIKRCLTYRHQRIKKILTFAP